MDLSIIVAKLLSKFTVSAYDYLDLDFEFHDCNDEFQSNLMQMINQTKKMQSLGVFYRHQTKESNNELNRKTKSNLR